MMKALRSMCGWTMPSPARFAIDRTHRCAVRRSRRCPSAPEEDRPLSAFADGEVDGPGRPGHERDGRGLVALPDDAQHSVAALEGEVLDVGRAGLAHPQAVEAEQDRQRSMGVVVSLSGEQERPELRAVEATRLVLVHLWAMHVLGRVR
jgi:hypothetical protein